VKLGVLLLQTDHKMDSAQDQSNANVQATKTLQWAIPSVTDGTSQTYNTKICLKQSPDESIKTFAVSMSNNRGLERHRGIIIRTENAFAAVLVTKDFNAPIPLRFCRSCGKCVELLYNYRQLCVECEELRKKTACSANSEYEQLLEKVLMPHEPLDVKVMKEEWENLGNYTKKEIMEIPILKEFVSFVQERPRISTCTLSQKFNDYVHRFMRHCYRSHKFETEATNNSVQVHNSIRAAPAILKVPFISFAIICFTGKEFKKELLDESLFD